MGDSEEVIALKRRLALADALLGYLKNAKDARAPSAIEVYQRQRDEIQARLDALPHDVTVSLKAASLQAVAKK